MHASELLAIARLTNSNRRLSTDLLAARSQHLRDIAMFANLKSLVAEAKSEARTLIGSFGSEISGLETEVKDLISSFKTAQTNVAKTATDAKTLGQDIVTDVKDLLTFKTTAVATLGALELEITGTSAPTVGSLVSAAGIAAKTLVASIDAAAGKLGLSLPTIADIEAGATITVTPAA